MYDTTYNLKRIPKGTKHRIYMLEGARNTERFILEAIAEKLEREEKKINKKK
jgi:hypothetical protein